MLCSNGQTAIPRTPHTPCPPQLAKHIRAHSACTLARTHTHTCSCTCRCAHLHKLTSSMLLDTALLPMLAFILVRNLRPVVFGGTQV
jgi:hypothetical protein